MRKLESFLKETAPKFIEFMKVSQRWSITYEGHLARFDKWIASNYPDGEMLSQEMVDVWCRIREKESVNANLARINVVTALVRYMRKHGMGELKEPDRPRPQKNTHTPHAFTADELERFFHVCDSMEINEAYKDSAVNKMILCVLFRLMYSTGIRPIEARELKRAEVDLKEGVLNIVQTKGHDQHYVAVHESMLGLLCEYDKKMEGLVPQRVYFFPNGASGHKSKEWLRSMFADIWKQANPSTHAVSYDFRHNYATTNINRWVGGGYDFYDKMYYLSKSMGHCCIEHTKYYYSIVPRLSDLLDEKSCAGFDELVPEVMENEIW